MYCWVSKEAIAFAAKNTKRKRRSSPNESKDLLLVSEEAASGSGGSAGTSLETNNEDVATDDEVSGAPRSAVLQACTLTSGLLLAVGNRCKWRRLAYLGGACWSCTAGTPGCHPRDCTRSRGDTWGSHKRCRGHRPPWCPRRGHRSSIHVRPHASLNYLQRRKQNKPPKNTFSSIPERTNREQIPSSYSYIPQPSSPEMCYTHRGGVAVHGVPIRAIHEFINAGPPLNHCIPWLPLPRVSASSPSGSHANGRPPHWEPAVRLRPDSLCRCSFILPVPSMWRQGARLGMATGTYPSGSTIPYPYPSKKNSTRRITHICSRV
jgi:hypothetical protein